MNRGVLGRRRALLLAAVGLSLLIPSRLAAQFGGPPPPPPEPRKGAPVDLTGYWVSIVTEDWRFRMITPDKGDYDSLPITAEGRRIADAWDPAKDEANGDQCKSYGAPALLRVPERLHISWENDTTLKLETDAGMQTREFHFGGTPPDGAAPTLQGYSVASWEGLSRGAFGQLPTVAGGGAPRPAVSAGYLKVVTSQLRPGYLRKNGVPYSAKTTVVEYFESFTEQNGDKWLVVTTIVNDPQYLFQPFVTSSPFKKIPDGAGWNPTPCEAK